MKTLDKGDLLQDPIEMSTKWVEEAIQAKCLEPTSMCLSTVSKDNQPSSRIVLLKELREDGFVFFTNYMSKKAQDIDLNNKVALNFCWHELERQIRIEGNAYKLDSQDSDKYYDLRPEESKIGAWASPQSQIIPNREFLESLLVEYKDFFQNRPIHRPDEWGGFVVKPTCFEFWQGRKSRLHDRFRYQLTDRGAFLIDRLAP